MNHSTHDGRWLPQAALGGNHQGAVQMQRSRQAGALWEQSVILRLTSCAELSSVAAHQPNHPVYRAYAGRPTAQTAGIRRAVDELLGPLPMIMNGQMKRTLRTPKRGSAVLLETLMISR